jgi:polysaccharide chain length determinant protein (PEP-CTERM system associated)
VLPGKKYTPEDILRILWRHKWLVVVPFAVATVAATVVAKRLPSVYRAETLIQVMPQRIPESYVRATVTTRIEDRLGSIQQTILSRSRLERIINDFALYPQQRQLMPMEDVVVLMRERDVNVRVERGDAFRVSYIAGDPRVAQKVAERLGSLFIDENLRDREALAEQTSQFLEGQLEDARRRLVEHEKKLEDYRRLHAGELPTQLQGNLQAIQNAQLQLQSNAEAMNRDRERRLLLERQLADVEASDVAPPPVPLSGASSETPVTGGSSVEQLDVAVAQRRALLIRFKPDHPDVLALDRRIRALEQKVQAERGSRPSQGEPAPRAISAAEILRQNRLRDLRANLEAVDRDLAVKQETELRLRAVVASYQAKVDAAPTRESELTELTRDYATIQNIYTSLLAKREDSKIAANVERQQIGEQFKILDPARVPERPFSPNRLRIVAMGAAAGLGLGLVVLGFLEYRDTTFKSEEDITRVLQLPVLALVPMMASEIELEVRRRRRTLVGTLVLLLVVGSAAAVAVWKLGV